jgi:DNA processing protein
MNDLPVSLNPSDWRFWLALKSVRGVGNVVGLSLVRAFGHPRAVFAASAQALECAGLRRGVAREIRRFDRWAEVERQLARLETFRGRLVTWDDEAYPENLRHIHDPPLFFFVKGDLLPADGLAIAVVGSRVASPYGLRMTAQIAEGLARLGVTVVSGLARGVDGQAHAAALRAGGRTIAVLGCGIDVTYPSEHHRLQMQIARNGAVVSEFPMGAPPDAENFPARNRVISGMSLGTLVVEAAEKSGSLITARSAAEQGREVFAVPGPVGATNRGTHHLLRQGATLVETAEDIIRELAPHVLSARPQPPPQPLDGVDARVFACLTDTGVHVDQIIEQTGLPPAAVLESLLHLELRGLIRQQPGKYFARENAGARRAPADR